MKKLHLAVLVPAALSLTACGGGGGGSSAFVRPNVEFTGALQANAINYGTSIDQSFSYTNSGTTITSVTGNSTGTGTVYLGLDANGDLDYGRFVSTTGGSDITLGDQAGDAYIADSVGSYTVIVGANSDLSEIAYMYSNDNWDYNAFGYWLEDTSATSGRGSAFSVGYATPGSSIPTSGSATYTGLASGFYVDSSGNAYLTAANARGVTDFSNRSVTFTTSSTNTLNLVTDVSATNSNLNLSGTLTYGAGSNSLSGNITSTGGLNGTATAKFYGGLYQEMGGTYKTTVSGTEYMVGSFGMSR
jgi:hypothetical protein